MSPRQGNPLLLVLGISAAFFVVFVAVAVAMVGYMSQGRPQKTTSFFGGSGNIGVIEIKGIIMDSRRVLDEIERFGEDPLIRAVLVRVNSPGGAVAPSQEIYDSLRKLDKKKPVYGSMGTLAASGGYYVSLGTRRIFASPGTLTGSIGVIMQFADLSKLYQWAKVSPYNVKTGKYKDIGSPNREMSPEEKALLQDMIDNVLGQFRKAVAISRGLSMEKVIEVSDGRIFSGEQAKRLKLIDDLGGILDAADALGKEAGIKGKPTLVYPRKKRYIERLFGESDDDSESEASSVATLIARAASLFRGIGNAVDLGDRSTRLMGPLFILPKALE